jgi:hypothetical protein
MRRCVSQSAAADHRDVVMWRVRDAAARRRLRERTGEVGRASIVLLDARANLLDEGDARQRALLARQVGRYVLREPRGTDGPGDLPPICCRGAGA